MINDLLFFFFLGRSRRVSKKWEANIANQEMSHEDKIVLTARAVEKHMSFVFCKYSTDERNLDFFVFYKEG